MEGANVFKIESHVNGKVSSATEKLLQELALVRAENKALRNKLDGNGRGSKVVRTAIVDAHQLIMNAFSGANTGRLAMAEQGVTKWAWAVAFLRYAGIVSMDGRKWRSGLEFIVKDLAECVSLLEKAGAELMERPDGYRALRKLLRSV